jgi:hypothetical protein
MEDKRPYVLALIIILAIAALLLWGRTETATHGLFRQRNVFGLDCRYLRGL